MAQKYEMSITEFWNQNFQYVETTTTIPKSEVFNFFQETHGKTISYQDFTIAVGNTGVQSKKARRCNCFLAAPKSQQAMNYFEDKDSENLSGISQVTPTTKKMETISKFWDTHYQYKGVRKRTLPTAAYSGEEIELFKRISGNPIRV